MTELRSPLNSKSKGSTAITELTNATGTLAIETPSNFCDLSESEPELRQRSVLDATRKRLITILIIGETGCGKTSLMSLLVNLFRGHGPLELQEWHNKSAESGLSKHQSQTTTATFYTITTKSGLKIQLLDTPGLADTRGIDQDNKHKAEINGAIKEYVTSIDAVLIIANGTVPRLTAATNYTLSVITSMFPRSIIDNIGFIFTNSDLLTLNFDPESLPVELRESKRWLLQNPLAMIGKYRYWSQSPNVDAKQVKKLTNQLTTSYDESVDTLNEWLKWVDERQVQPTKEIDRLYNISMNIEAHIEAALLSLTHSSDERARYRRISENLQNAKKQRKALDDFIAQETAPVWERESSAKVNTICIASNCYGNCHTPCRMPFQNDPADLGCWCLAFGESDGDGDASSKCLKCGHLAQDHRHYHHINIRKPREMSQDTRTKLSNATSEQEQLEIAMQAANQKIKKLGQDAAQTQKTIRSLVNDFNELSISQNFAGHLRSVIQVLELRRKELESKGSTDSDLQLIDESIEKFKKKLDVLTGPWGMSSVATLAKSLVASLSWK
ncbi:AIG1 domain-containing protein [Ceratobasidium sp. AG-Ba]|nr:AIG1 domain-containing protein [Ceratobasidium sp. AG-Ba]